MDIGFTTIGAYLGAAIAMGLGAIGSALGEGVTAHNASKAMARQPKSSGDVMNLMLVGQAVSETAGIFSLLVALMLLFQPGGDSITGGIALIAAGISIGFGALGAGYGAGLPARAACEAVARDPDNQNQITITMLVGQAVTQTPVIFALVVSFLLIMQTFADSFVVSAALIGAGLSMGFGAIGPGIGSGMAAEGAVEMVGRNKNSNNNVVRLMLIGQAVAQTPVVFALVISFLLIFQTFGDSFLTATALVAAGISMGFGAIGPGIGSGITACNAIQVAGAKEKLNSIMMRTMLLGQSVAQSTAIYSMVVALILIYVI